MSLHVGAPALSGAAAEDHAGLLRLALKLDAVTCGVAGVLALVAGPALDELLGAPLRLLWPVGGFLVVYAAALWVAASRPSMSRPLALMVVALNLVWVLASIVTVAAGWFAWTVVGVAVVLAQAVAVLLIADLQVVGLRRARVMD